MTREERSGPADVLLAGLLALLAALVSGGVLLNVAELQSAALLTVRAQAPEAATDQMPFDITLLGVIAAGCGPLLVLAVSIVRRWPLSYFLAWLVAVILVAFFAGCVAGFATYRYWRDHQAVAFWPTIEKRVSGQYGSPA